MIDLVALEHENAVLLWAHIGPRWGLADCQQLRLVVEAMALPPESQLVLDFAEARHIDYRAIPDLIMLGREMERRAGRFRLAGFSEYLQRIMELGGALEGREFVENHRWNGPLLRVRVRDEETRSPRPMPRGLSFSRRSVLTPPMVLCQN